jgi:hypothetical protein
MEELSYGGTVIVLADASGAHVVLESLPGALPEDEVTRDQILGWVAKQVGDRLGYEMHVCAFFATCDRPKAIMAARNLTRFSRADIATKPTVHGDRLERAKAAKPSRSRSSQARSKPVAKPAKPATKRARPGPSVASPAQLAAREKARAAMYPRHASANAADANANKEIVS